jgi:hypothetical protein
MPIDQDLSTRQTPTPPHMFLERTGARTERLSSVTGWIGFDRWSIGASPHSLTRSTTSICSLSISLLCLQDTGGEGNERPGL